MVADQRIVQLETIEKRKWFADAITKARKLFKNQTELGDAVGVSQETISHWMKAHYPLKEIEWSKLLAVSKLIKVPEEEIFRRNVGLEPSSHGLDSDPAGNNHAADVQLYGALNVSFIGSLDLPEVKRFRIIAISGQSTLRSFLAAIGKHNSNSKVPIRAEILLRSREYVDKGRKEKIDASMKMLDEFRRDHTWFTFETRTYSCPTPFLAVVCELKDGKRIARLGSYTWQGTNLRESFNAAAEAQVEIDERKGAAAKDNYLELYLAWFNHFWGHHRIHTILFDFDDTLFETTHAQVDGWLDVISDNIKKKFIAESDFRSKADFEKLRKPTAQAREHMCNIFLDEQTAAKIVIRLFKPNETDRISGLIEGRRKEKRRLLTESTAEPIEGVIEDVRKLSKEYQMVIVSATSEDTILGVLKDNDLSFPYVYGASPHRPVWQSIQNKAQQFIFVSNVIGIPLDRMVFVGDSEADFQAAKQLGMPFIENRYAARKNGRESLLKGGPTKFYISGEAKPGELVSAVQAITK